MATLLQKFEAICDEIFDRWDADMRPGKLLSALTGRITRYRPDVDEVRRALTFSVSEDRERDLLEANNRYLEEARAARAALAARFDLVGHLERQRIFSLKTFGPGPRTKGILDHIRKELIEIEADPADIAEWVDVIALAFDGAWRAGWEPADILAAIVAKQAKNEARTWPDWRTADPDKAIEHYRSHDHG